MLQLYVAPPFRLVLHSSSSSSLSLSRSLAHTTFASLLVYVSNPAERLGRYFSRGTPAELSSAKLPKFTALGVFEIITGIKDVRMGGGYDSMDNLTSCQGVSAAKLAKNFISDGAKSGRERLGGTIVKGRERFANLDVEELKRQFLEMDRESMVKAISAVLERKDK